MRDFLLVKSGKDLWKIRGFRYRNCDYLLYFYLGFS